MVRVTDESESRDDEAAERARVRRERWTGGVARDGIEMDKVNAELWRAVPPDDRLGFVFDMWNEQMSLKDPSYEAPARLQRSAGGVRPRRS